MDEVYMLNQIMISKPRCLSQLKWASGLTMEKHSECIWIDILQDTCLCGYTQRFSQGASDKQECDKPKIT